MSDKQGSQAEEKSKNERQVQKEGKESNSERKSTLIRVPELSLFGVIVLIVLAGMIIAVILAVLTQTTLTRGFQLYPESVAPSDTSEALSAAIATMMGAFREITRIVLLAFGAVAFLVTYQREAKISVGAKDWRPLLIGLAFLFVALCLSITCQEILLYMVAENSIRLNFIWLTRARYALYLVFALGAFFIAAYAYALATARLRRA